MDRTANEAKIVRYQPRTVVALDHWSHPPFNFKVYGLCDLDRSVDGTDRTHACTLAAARIADIKTEQGQTYPGFMIYHKGSEGITLQLYWWVEGCILCQDHIRLPDSGEDPIASLRYYVVGCVWELALLDHEKTAWRQTMMSAPPDVDAYLRCWFDETTV
jgi:hypothetical protein